jgi:transcriptional regulator with XRE-family HTH domain
MEPNQPTTIGDLIRTWRKRRHLSQLDLAGNAEISQRHLSFLELGRSQPSREMVLHLAEHLKVPLREQNIWLTAAGFAAGFPERHIDDASLHDARKIVDLILNGLEPNPSFAVDRHWTLVATNQAANILLAEVDPILIQPPVNLLRLCLHPQGFTRKIMNYSEWRKCLLDYLNQQVAITADPFLIALLTELSNYPRPASARDDLAPSQGEHSRFAIPLRLMTKAGELSFISTVTIFGTPIDVTLSELAIESFFPANEQTSALMMANPLSPEHDRRLTIHN